VVSWSRTTRRKSRRDETNRCWCDKFGAGFAQCAKAARRKPGSTWHLDEMFVTLRGEPYLL
jgi:putative transposase